jgi:predicted HTH transcriptional regulator
VGQYVDRKTLTGTLPELIDAAAAWLKLHNQVGAVIEGFQRVDLPDYPLEPV